ncbi:hypothetical protein AYO20_11279 [Fonsecaea nubica]|uniref:Protein kinase domain-containing protein n=1 Tax=Fonsecaea nubica TaxID=856822 RepID=A0A178BZE5_9EURO|nr:hypothetical protein AYO20_11279 [Fonsecaea nubica]OAL22043.1 hypothetical protein AYO20_11279 [Fonsecaea nubica]
MPPFENQDFDSLLLKPFELNGGIRFETYAGGGRSGHCFKVRIRKKDYALKMFKFDNPELNVCRLRGTERRAFHDPFYIECPAYGTLIEQGFNGHITTFCYGWIDVPCSVELHVPSQFGIQPVLWDKPADVDHQQVRGILLEWVDGRPPTQIVMTSNIANQARKLLKALHGVGILHGGVAASNLLVEESN